MFKRLGLPATGEGEVVRYLQRQALADEGGIDGDGQDKAAFALLALLIGLPAIAHQPAGIFAYWVPAASFGTTQLLLFRYSALTFNGHRIHYDPGYARDIEGYAGLVVHGPLLAQLLMLLARRQLGHLTRFSFRATSPLMHFETADLCWGGDGTLWVRGPDGRQCMTAKAD